MVNQVIIRINYNTLVRLKAIFPSMRGETMKDYFNRVVKYIEEYNNGFTKEEKEKWKRKSIKNGLKD